MSDTPFNGLTPAQAERLAMLAEEAGEIVQMVGKILRHGYDSYHPRDPDRSTNRELLRREIQDLRGVVYLMDRCSDLMVSVVDGEVDAAAMKKLRYSHHQHEDPAIVLFNRR